MTNVLTAHRKLTCRLSNTFRLTFEAVQMMLHNPSGKQDTKPFGKTVIVFTSTVDTAHVGLRQCDMLHSTIGAVFLRKMSETLHFRQENFAHNNIWMKFGADCSTEKFFSNVITQACHINFH